MRKIVVRKNDVFQQQIIRFPKWVLAKSNQSNSLKDTVEQSIEKKVGKSKIILPLYEILLSGTKVIFYRNELNELKELQNQINKQTVAPNTHKIVSLNF